MALNISVDVIGELIGDVDSKQHLDLAITKLVNLGLVDEECRDYYLGSYTNLSFYEAKAFDYNVDFGTIATLEHIYQEMVDYTFRTNIVDYIQTVYLWLTGQNDLGFLDIVELQLPWFCVIFVLAAQLAIAVLSMAHNLFSTVKSGGSSYQKISPWLDLERNILGLLMVFLTLFIFIGFLLGTLGNSQLSAIKSSYEEIVDSSVSYLETYLTNVTRDIETISLTELEFMLETLEEKMYEYQQEAATGVFEVEASHALEYSERAEQLIPLEEEIREILSEALAQLNSAYTIAASVESNVSTCYEAVLTYCASRSCNGSVFIPENVAPLTIIDLDNWEFQVNTERVIGYGIPSFTKANYEIWENSTEYMMESNQPVRDDMHNHHQELLSWLKKSLAKTDLQVASWMVQIEAVLPVEQSEFLDSSSFGQQFEWEGILLIVVYMASFVTALACVGLLAVGLCVSESGTLPTERSALSNTIGFGMKLGAGLYSIQVVIVLALTIPHFMVSSVLTESCHEINEVKMNPFWLWDWGITHNYSIISTSIGDEVSNITFKGFIDSCERDESLYTALNLTNIWDIDNSFNIYGFLGYYRITQDSGLGYYGSNSFYRIEEAHRIRDALTVTNYNITAIDGSLDEILPYLTNRTETERGLLILETEKVTDFIDAANAARDSLSWVTEDDLRDKLEYCINNITSWSDEQANIINYFLEYWRAIDDGELLSKIEQYHDLLKLLISENQSMFDKSGTTYVQKMREAYLALGEDVECYVEIAKHQYKYILGRCRPLYNIYYTINQFICTMLAPTYAIITVSLLFLSFAMFLFLFTASLIVPYFQCMTVLHPDDKLRQERAAVAKGEPAPITKA